MIPRRNLKTSVQGTSVTTWRGAFDGHDATRAVVQLTRFATVVLVFVPWPERLVQRKHQVRSPVCLDSVEAHLTLLRCPKMARISQFHL